MLNTIKTRILRIPFFRAVNQLRYEDFDPIYNTNHLDNSYYEKVKHLGDVELEHQIGRLTNYKKILSEIAQENLIGDVVEFGSWRGFSLMWIAILMQDIGLFSKKLLVLMALLDYQKVRENFLPEHLKIQVKIWSVVW